MIKAILFDLDGTLLPMDQDVFTKMYFGLLAKHLAPHGYDADKLIKAIWYGIKGMVQNDGRHLNDVAFWNAFEQMFERDVRADEPLFYEFYEKYFCGAKPSCGFQPEAAKLIQDLKAAEKRVVLATNPIFPAIATEQRIQWAGLKKEDFELVTTYENTGFCKPNPDYYRNILEQQGLVAEECMMVGNDVGEDMIARELGMEVFLLTDCLINKVDADIEEYPHGDFTALREYLESKGILA